MPKNMPKTIWADNQVQFPRLIAEVWALLDQGTMQMLAEEMSLTGEELLSLFERADKEWQKIKSKR